MSTTSRRVSAASKSHRPNHTPGKTKGGHCVRPKDYGVAIAGNPYKGQGLSARHKNTYTRLWDRYKSAKGNA